MFPRSLSLALLVACFAPAGSVNVGLVYEAAYFPIHSNAESTHIQFPVNCRKCFQRSNGSLEDGLLNFNFLISRSRGIDGDDACIINGNLVLEADYPRNLFKQAREAPRLTYDEDEPIARMHLADIQYRTLVSNRTHDIKAISYIVPSWNSFPLEPLDEVTGFMLSYMRRPYPKMIRIDNWNPPTSVPTNPDEIEAWTNPLPHQLWSAIRRPELDMSEDIFAGFETYWLECKTLACHVNKLKFKINKAYTECRELRNADSDEQPMPLHCLLYIQQQEWWTGILLSSVLFVSSRILFSKVLHLCLAFRARREAAQSHMLRYMEKKGRESPGAMMQHGSYWAKFKSWRRRQVKEGQRKAGKRLYGCRCLSCHPTYVDVHGNRRPKYWLRVFLGEVILPIGCIVLVFWLAVYVRVSLAF